MPQQIGRNVFRGNKRTFVSGSLKIGTSSYTVINGEDFCTTTITGAHVAGAEIFQQELNPLFFVDQFQEAWGENYKKFRVLSLKCVVQGASGTETDGTVVFSFDNDPDNVLNDDSVESLHPMANLPARSMAAPFQTSTSTYRPPGIAVDLDVLPLGEQRLWSAGTFRIFTQNDLPAGYAGHNLFWSFKIAFLTPEVKPSGFGGFIAYAALGGFGAFISAATTILPFNYLQGYSGTGNAIAHTGQTPEIFEIAGAPLKW